MASYYDEHNCEPLRDGETPNHNLLLARLLLDTGIAVEWEMEYSRLFHGERPPPPTSKKVIEELPTVSVTQAEEDKHALCPVCLGALETGDEMKKLPCEHTFHPKCIIPWLQKTNSCPLCRHELPTDDEDYEKFKKQKARAKQREHDLETLHDSMFG